MKPKFVKNNMHFIKPTDPRRALKLGEIARTHFQNEKEFLNWFVNIVIPYYYGKDWKESVLNLFLEKSSYVWLPPEIGDLLTEFLEKVTIAGTIGSDVEMNSDLWEELSRMIVKKIDDEELNFTSPF